MVQPHRRRGLPIAPRDADDLPLEVATSQFDFRDDGDAVLADSHHDGSLLGNTGALDNLFGTQNYLGRMASFFVGAAVLFKFLLVLRGYLSVVRDQYGYTTALI